MFSKFKWINVVLALALALGVIGMWPTRSVEAVSADLRISQVYGGGGYTYLYDFIEIFNAGTSPVSLNGKSLQYASATGTGYFGGTANQITELPNVSLDPGKYYLVQEAAGTNR